MPPTRIHLPPPLLSQLDNRDAALWLSGPEVEGLEPDMVARLCRMPWNIVLSESADEAMLAHLDEPEPVEGLLVRRRGLVHTVDTDPAEILLPPRHLAVLLLNGRGAQRRTGMTALTRRLTMLSELRKRSIKQLVVAIAGPFEVPTDLADMWADGFRTIVTFVSDDPSADELIDQWRSSVSGPPVGLIRLSPTDFAHELEHQFLEGRDGKIVLRMRDERGGTRLVDVSEIDDPQRPVLAGYELLGNELLTSLLPSDLAAAEVDGFFANTTMSWRPYAAGMVWERDPSAWSKVKARLRSLDQKGPEENRILYISAESGAGATTFLRDLAWKSAESGYPTLVARAAPFTTSGLEMTNFLTRLMAAGDEGTYDEERLYETPCVLAFDQDHWSGRESELVSFAREIERSGRRVCILLVVGIYVGLGLQAERRFVELAHLTHQVTPSDALALGKHLNRYLSAHNTARSEQEWQAFFRSTSVQESQGIAAFWIVLSFWLQRQIDLGETVQSRVYRQFNAAGLDDSMRVAILRIAAFSTVRTPLPDALLPPTTTWPIADRLQDLRKELGALGLLRIQGDVDRYWAMAHDLLGRYLLTALFYDFEARKSLGYATALNPEHLRFLILKEISSLSALQRRDLREVAENFAITIFKIDPDHGHAIFVPFWREALEALDGMPKSLRTTSRTFLHHGAISRRRIAADEDLFAMPTGDRVLLLKRSVEDIEAALGLEMVPGEETDVNLYNSLALAYHDLADAQAKAEFDPAMIMKSRAAAREATRRAYSLNPDNSFVMETYARTLLSPLDGDSNRIVSNALEVLNLVYSLVNRPGFESRRNALSRLSLAAFDILLANNAGELRDVDPESEAGATVVALASLAEGVERSQGIELGNYPPENRKKAAALLAAPILAGNVQAVKLRYALAVLDDPQNFELQLELLQSLQGSGPSFTPQMELEMGLLLFQVGRSHEADRQFRRLRGLWRKGQNYVEVPQRLHWLLNPSRTDRRQVRAKVVSNGEGRSFARVQEFDNVEVPFRSAEFGGELLRPATSINGYVSFGHNGPLLRPLTASRR
ncbi:hypothetical protein FJ973_19730 [Mesorhizobium sp. B2-1-3]|nr:hypothetical protein FJ973_19730 [Mesorhizobium sp. B2-1-3]